PDASVERVAGKLILKAGSSSEICGERGASTHPFDPRYNVPTGSPLPRAVAVTVTAAATTRTWPMLEHCCDRLIRETMPSGWEDRKAVRGLDLPLTAENVAADAAWRMTGF
ncbi:unnamed protein product, partial [Ascophyllum nodosum]